MTSPKDPPEDVPKPVRPPSSSPHRANPAMNLGMQLAIAMALFAWIGVKLDHRFDTLPLFVLIGVGIAFTYGAYEIWKIVKFHDDDPEG